MSSKLTLVVLLYLSGIQSATVKFYNNCGQTVWPGLLSGAGTDRLPTTGFLLGKGESKEISTPVNWSGRLWGRTLCSEDASGKFTCATGDCGRGTVECDGGGAAPPATLAEFTLHGSEGKDFYDVSLVDGYNLPIQVSPRGGTGDNCTSTGCFADLNDHCPSELRVTAPGNGNRAVACRSACDAFGSAEYCCNGEFANPSTCRPTSYSDLFKNACPHAYSYAYDDATSTFTCADADSYVVTFCPTSSSRDLQKKTCHFNLITFLLLRLMLFGLF